MAKLEGLIEKSKETINKMRARIAEIERNVKLYAVRNAIELNKDLAHRASTISGALLAGGISVPIMDFDISSYVERPGMPTIAEVKWLKKEKIMQQQMQEYIRDREMLAANYEAKYWTGMDTVAVNHHHWDEITDSLLARGVYGPDYMRGIWDDCSRVVKHKSEVARKRHQQELATKEEKAAEKKAAEKEAARKRKAGTYEEGFKDGFEQAQALVNGAKEETAEQPAAEGILRPQTAPPRFDSYLLQCRQILDAPAPIRPEQFFPQEPLDLNPGDPLPSAPMTGEEQQQAQGFCGVCYMCKSAERKADFDNAIGVVYQGYASLTRAAYDRVKRIVGNERIRYQRPCRVPRREPTARDRMLDAAVFYMWEDMNDFEFIFS